MTAGGATGAELMEVFTTLLVFVLTGSANLTTWLQSILNVVTFVLSMDGEETAVVGETYAVHLRLLSNGVKQ